jgi:nucleoside-diphosphate-sugar epimerase
VNGAAAAGGLVFLTGATGFIGGRLAAVLHARRYRLRCLVRSPERTGALASLGAELIVGDVTDAAAITRGLEGADLACHLAGRYEIGRVDRTTMERVNIEGTRVFLDAVRAAGVSHAIHVSSTAALGPVATGAGDETSSYDGPYPSEYHRTKTAAHRLALAAQRDGLPLTIICPAYVYGPGDEGPAAQYITDLLRHLIPGLATRPSVFSYVHVDDVVSGLVAAIERASPGSIYVLSGETATVNDFSRRVVAAAGTWASPLRFPAALVRATGSMMDLVNRLTGLRMPLSRELAEVGGTGQRWVHSHARATAELGYSPRPLAEGLPETIADARARLSQ